jgi:hypothetical protein
MFEPLNLGWRAVNLHKEFQEKGTAVSIPTCHNGKLVDKEEPHPSNYRGCRHANEKI